MCVLAIRENKTIAVEIYRDYLFVSI